MICKYTVSRPANGNVSAWRDAVLAILVAVARQWRSQVGSSHAPLKPMCIYILGLVSIGGSSITSASPRSA
jgi:hypothetical protein